MRKTLAALLLALVVPLFAQDAPKAPLKSPVRGYLVDMLCARARKAEGIRFGQIHTKMCLHMKPCIDSGFAVMTPDYQILRFDKAGTEKALKMLDKTKQEQGFIVQVSGKIKGDEMKVSKIELLPPDSFGPAVGK